MNLNNAEVQVTTKQLIDNNDNDSRWFQLDNYAYFTEFDADCSDYFNTENDPVYRYLNWDNIPNALINKEWFCRNFFVIRDALDRLDEKNREFFTLWCRYHGHNVLTDDVSQLVSHFQDMHTSEIECNSPPDLPEETIIYECLVNNYFDLGRLSTEVFDDNYD